jgi:hypothetical protein
VDGALMARVCTDGLDILSVHVSGTKIDETFATLHFSGGRYPSGGQFTHLVWLSELALQPGQRVRIEVSEQGDTTHSGKTLAELFPDEPVEEQHDPMPSREQLIDEVRLRPHHREHFTLALQSSSGHSTVAEVGADGHGFGASVFWSGIREERIRASLDTYSLEQLASGDKLTYHFQERLYPDAWVEIKIDA